MPTIVDVTLDKTGIDMDLVSEVLFSTKRADYHYLYSLQRELIQTKRFDFNTSEIIKDKPHKQYKLYVDYEFIPIENRIAFKNSKWFGKSIDISDISKNPQIFQRSFIVFMNGYLYRDFKLQIDDECMYLIYEYKNTAEETHFQAYIDANLPLTIFTIQNTNRELIKTNKYALNTNGGFASPSIKAGYKYFAFFDKNHKSNIMSVIQGVPANGKYTTDINYSELTDGDIYMDIMSNNNIYTTWEFQNLSAETPEYRIPDTPMPIPIENLMSFYKKSGTDELLFDHTAKYINYYPNIYTPDVSTCTSDNLYTIVLYMDDTPNFIGMKHFNWLHRLYAVFDITDPNRRMDIDAYIKNFQPEPFIYDFHDFHTYEESTTKYWNYVQYKLDKINETVCAHPEILIDYLHAEVAEDTPALISTSKFDLDERTRNDNTTEITNNEYHETFSEPHCVFTIKNNISINPQILGIYINGVRDFTFKVYTNVAGYDYLYIKKELLKAPSIIEIERFDRYIFEDMMNYDLINNISPSTVNLPDSKIYLMDYMFRKMSTNKPLPDGSYTITRSYTNYNGIITRDITNDTRNPVKNCSMEYSEPTTIRIRNYIAQLEYPVTEDFTRSFQIFIPINDVSSKYKIRVYKNGSYLDIRLYQLEFTDIGINIKVLTLLVNSDIIVVEILPHANNKVIYYQENLPPNGIIDIPPEVLDKPLSHKYHRFYINGKKIPFTLLDIVKTNRFLIDGMTSLKHLVITENAYVYNPFNYEAFWNTSYENVGDLITDPGDNVDTDEDLESKEEDFIGVLEEGFFKRISRMFLEQNKNIIPDHLSDEFKTIKNENGDFEIDSNKHINVGGFVVFEFDSNREL